MRTDRIDASATGPDRLFDDGMLGEEYELVGVFNEDPDREPGYEYEIFVVAVNSEV